MPPTLLVILLPLYSYRPRFMLHYSFPSFPRFVTRNPSRHVQIARNLHIHSFPNENNPALGEFFFHTVCNMGFEACYEIAIMLAKDLSVF